MAKYCVPILAVRHAHVVVEADSEQDAVVKGWEAIKANAYRWLCDTIFSVEKPFPYLTLEDFEPDDIPQEHGTVVVSAQQLKPYVSQLLRTQK